jgi:hypothetical protein
MITLCMVPVYRNLSIKTTHFSIKNKAVYNVAAKTSIEYDKKRISLSFKQQLKTY